MNKKTFFGKTAPVVGKFELGKGPTKTEWEASQKAIQEEQARLGAAYNRLRAHPAMKDFPRGTVASDIHARILASQVKIAAFPLPLSKTLPFALDSLTSIEKAERAGFNALEEIAVPILKAQYEAEIETWDWDDIREDCKNFAEEDEWEEGQIIGKVFLGTVFSLNPSGKYWTCWAAGNMNDDETLADIAFNEALEAVAQRQGGWVEAGEGDPCDIFFGMVLESQD